MIAQLHLKVLSLIGSLIALLLAGGAGFALGSGAPTSLISTALLAYAVSPLARYALARVALLRPLRSVGEALGRGRRQPRVWVAHRRAGRARRGDCAL